MMSVIHAPGQIPVLEDDYLFNQTHETRWSYGNIASSTKVYYATRMGCPITILQWQLKRYNLRLASYASDAEGSLRMLCDLCAKFQLMHPQPNPYLRWQGCSQCITKTTYIDATGQVINIPVRFIPYLTISLGSLRSIWHFRSTHDIHCGCPPTISRPITNPFRCFTHCYAQPVSRLFLLDTNRRKHLLSR